MLKESEWDKLIVKIHHYQTNVGQYKRLELKVEHQITLMNL
jgi:hypothetical protein